MNTPTRPITPAQDAAPELGRLDLPPCPRVPSIAHVQGVQPLPRARTSGFCCQECGHKFKTVKAAERAAFGERGCPKCGGADIDLSGGL